MPVCNIPPISYEQVLTTVGPLLRYAAGNTGPAFKS
jgi:hypothetical protein